MGLFLSFRTAPSAGGTAWALDTAAAAFVNGGIRHLVLKNEFLVS